MNPTLEAIQQQVELLAQQIDAPKSQLPSFGHSLDGGHPHIEGGGERPLYYVIVERGQELSRVEAAGIDDLLYRVFADISFSMAVNFELHHRMAGEDARRQLFAKQEALLGMLNPAWAERSAAEHRHILAQYPYNDQ